MTTAHFRHRIEQVADQVQNARHMAMDGRRCKVDLELAAAVKALREVCEALRSYELVPLPQPGSTNWTAEEILRQEG